MYSSKSRSLHIDNNSIMGREGNSIISCGYRSWFTTSRTLRLSSLILHSALVTIHLAFVGIWAGGLEHRFTVALKNEKLVSFLISATTTAFGTIYSALLVFATQTLSMRRSLQMDQVLTATHDNAAAWAGVGAAISHLWSQKTVPARASTIGILTATLYLTTILGLHITTSSLFSLVTVDSTCSFGAPTHGLPSFNSSPTTLIYMDVYAAGSLYYLPSILDRATCLGLHEGTLYDVLNFDPVQGNATVNASGFNVTCGYMADIAGLQSLDLKRWMTAENSDLYITPTRLHHFLQHHSDSGFQSQNWTPGPFPPSKSFNAPPSLVNRTAIVDAQSRQLQALGPDFKKADSTWVPYTRFVIHSHCRPLLVRQWGSWYEWMPNSDFPLFVGSASMASMADIFLIQKLNLPAANHNSTVNVTLHEVENALTIIVASMFWTSTSVGVDASVGIENGTSWDSLSDVPKSPILLQGNATVTEIFTQVRLELSIIACSTDEKDMSVDGTGIIHVIWLYRNHPELDSLLEQVEHPTDDNLRAAGLVQTRLVGGRVQKERRKSF
ncbi:hypothetical protein B0H13DRAFT_2422460 [Mycena leptocephala]|nr:hypothetical protein B0H13DRAFT_2422460 [Mycena leptocephala]